MNFIDEQVQDLDSIFIKTCLDKMDPDVATRFVLSGLSLSKAKIEDAFILACKEMQLRDEIKRKEEDEKLKKELSTLDLSSPGKPSTTPKTDSKKTTTDDTPGKSLAKLLEDIFLTATKKTEK